MAQWLLLAGGVWLMVLLVRHWNLSQLDSIMENPFEESALERLHQQQNLEKHQKTAATRKNLTPLASVPANFSADEKALMRLAVLDITQYQTRKAYGLLYEQFASDTLRAQLPRRHFLKLCQCLEQTFGSVMGEGNRPLRFTQELKTGNIQANHSVLRGGADLPERLLLKKEAGSYRLEGIFWITPRRDFAECAKRALTLNTP